MKFTKDFNQLYAKKTMIGSGAFGKVFLGNRRDVGESHQLAIKQMNLEAIRRKMLNSEIAVLEDTDHPNIAGPRDLLRDEQHCYIVMDYFADGDLFDYATTQKLTEQHIASIAFQLLYALNYLHSNGFVHRDVKLENVLMKSKKECKVKLCDFGFAAKIDKPLT